MDRRLFITREPLKYCAMSIQTGCRLEEEENHRYRDTDGSILPDDYHLYCGRGRACCTTHDSLLSSRHYSELDLHFLSPVQVFLFRLKASLVDKTAIFFAIFLLIKRISLRWCVCMRVGNTDGPGYCADEEDLRRNKKWAEG